SCACLLAVPSNPDIEKVLSSVGIEADSTRVTKVVNELKGKSVVKLIASSDSLPAARSSPGCRPVVLPWQKKEKRVRIRG
ncbi:hypothetical protein pipiens_020393, partial [Culex pipiens pipiens]